MSNAAKHRKRAAEFEQLRQIDRAIGSYVRAIEESELEGEEVDVALLNKVGDLALRQGRVPDAITYYERAVEHYTHAGLFNNAIALCNKILRSAPGRASVYFTLGRICARNGLRGDATRNFLEYATRMRLDGRVDEGMRALAEVAELMPELTEVRRLVDEHAERAGIVLPRRRTPPLATVAVTEDPSRVPVRDKSPDLVFLEVDYETPVSRGTPVRAGRPVPPPMESIAPESTAPTLGAISIELPPADFARLDCLEVSRDYADPGGQPLDGFMVEQTDVPADVVDPGGHPQDVTWLADVGSLRNIGEEPGFVPNAAADLGGTTDLHTSLEDIESEDFEHATDDPIVAHIILTETPLRTPAIAWPNTEDEVEPFSFREVDAEALAGASDAAVAGSVVAERRLPFRMDPNDFILPGELPPLILDDAVVDAGVALAGDLGAWAQEQVTDGAVAPARGDTWDESPATARPVLMTPAVPIAAVAAEATLVATSRRDALRAAVAKLPQDWLLRRRLAEALFEAGDRDAALAELETALQGVVAQGDLKAGADISDTLVQVSPERVAFHQKRVELSVRLQDQQRLRVAYLDLADALIRVGEDNRARAVYARVLDIDPYDERALTALGSAAPPPPPPPKPGSDANFVDLAEWLRDEDAPASTRMRMREPTISGDEQADFDALLRHFKEGVARSLGEDDHESHYDLGVAFKEMGLLDDAVEEFQKALRSRSHRLPAYEALGQCFVEQERYQVATTVLSRALHEQGLDDEQRVGILYLLAYSCEALQRWDEARSYYQRVYATDIHFRDAAVRLAALDQVVR
jgi:tetratricopeptide (TPR) repeat protein